MNRLRDETWFDPISEKGIEALHPVRPTASSPGLKRRVWAAVQETSIASRFPRRSSVLRYSVIGVGLVAFAATAAATIAGSLARSKHIAPVRVVAEAESSLAPRTLHQPSVSQRPARAEGRAPARGALRPSHVVPVAAETSQERAQIWEALVALRRDRDPNRARALLTHALEVEPHGVLRQEALVLAIEAADACGDRPGAESFARTYQREFPSGRFRPFAQGYLDQKNARLRSLPWGQ